MCSLHGIHAQKQNKTKKKVREECKTAFFWLWILCAKISTTASEKPVKMPAQVRFGSTTYWLKNYAGTMSPSQQVPTYQYLPVTPI